MQFNLLAFSFEKTVDFCVQGETQYLKRKSKKLYEQFVVWRTINFHGMEKILVPQFHCTEKGISCNFHTIVFKRTV